MLLYPSVIVSSERARQGSGQHRGFWTTGLAAHFILGMEVPLFVVLPNRGERRPG
jgi:hypothetical protein